jgi:hypothetical protein
MLLLLLLRIVKVERSEDGRHCNGHDEVELPRVIDQGDKFAPAFSV